MNKVTVKIRQVKASDPIGISPLLAYFMQNIKMPAKKGKITWIESISPS